MRSNIFYPLVFCFCAIFCFTGQAQPVNYNINVTSNVFTPNSQTLTVGDTVTWTNTGGSHNVNGTQVTYSSNPESFGNSVGAGWTYSYVFTTAGNYDYRCDPHFGFGMSGTLTVQAAVNDSVYINEIHYDNSGTDVGEGVEIAGPAGVDLACYRLVFYDGGDSLIYNSNPILNLSGVIPDQACGYGTVWFALPTNGLQNGARDAICLYDTCNASVVQFLSYEGGITAKDNVALGLTSTDIGVSESSGTAVGQSMQLIGTGALYTDFTWATGITATPNQVNTGQIFCAGDTIISFAGSSVTVNEDTGTFTIELSIVNPSPSTAFTVDVVYSTGTATMTSDFTFGTQTVTFPAGDSTNKTINITIVDDTISENSESIVLILQNASAGTKFGSDSIFTVNIAGNDVVIPSCSNLFYSEYIEGSSNNKALEIYNPRTDTIDLAGYIFLKRTNGPGTINSYVFNGMLAPGEVFVVVNSSADSINLLPLGDTTSSLTFFNGDDALAIIDTISGDTIDKFGEWGVDPGSSWTVDTGSSQNYTLVRKASIQQGQLYWNLGANEWDVYAQNDFTHVGSHTMTACAAASATANFSSDAPGCLGDSICFTDLSVAGGGAIASWLWDFGDGVFSTDQNPCHTYAMEGSFTVILTVTDDSSNVDASPGTVVTIDTAATANAGANDTICAGDGLNLAGAIGGSASSSTWTTGGDGTFSNAAALNSSYNTGAADITAGTVTLYLTTDNPAGACGAVMDSMILVINQLATTAAGVDQTICLADLISLSGAIGGSASSSTWITMGDGSFADSSLLATTYTTGPTDNGMGSVTIVLATDDPTGPCSAVSDTLVITINAPAIANAGLYQTVCADMSCVSLSGSVTGITSTGIWTTTGGGTFTPSPTDLNACYAPSAADTVAGSAPIILTSTNNGVCTADADTIAISFNPLPSLGGTAVIDSSSCGNSDGNITGITASGIATLTYDWVDGLSASVGSAADLLLVPSDCYTLTVTDGNSCIATSGPHCINDAGTPGVPTAAGGATYCSGDAIADLTATGAGGLLIWFSDALLTTPVDSGSPFVSGVTTTDTFYVAELGACLGLADMVVITVNDVPTSAFSTANVCLADSAMFIDASTIASGTIASWAWDFGDAGTSTTQNPSHLYAAAGTYAVGLVVMSSNSCVDSVTMSTTVYPDPLVAFSSADVCLGTASTFTDLSTISSGTIASWSWDFDDGNTSSMQNPTNNYASAGAYTVMFIVTSDNGCAAVDSMTVNVGATIVVNAGPDQSTCAGAGCVTLAGSVLGGSTTGMWVSMGTGTFTPNDSDLVGCYLPSAADEASGSVILVLNSTNNGVCAAVSDSMVITIGAGAVADAGADQTVCGTSCVSLSGAVSGGSSTGQWSSLGSGSFVPNDSNLAACYQPSAADSTAGSVVLVLTSTNNGACLAISDTMMITFGQDATANAGADASACGSSAVTLAGSIGGGASSSTWSTSGDGIFDNPSSLTAIYTPGTADMAAGTVTLTLTTDDPAGACLAATDDLAVTISPVPLAVFSSSTTNLTVAFTNMSTIQFGGVIASWAWDFGDGNASGIETPTNVYSDSGSYNVCLTATSGMGCPDVACETVIIVDPGVGMSEINLDQHIAIFPNPSSNGMINIHVSADLFKGAAMRVLNPFGQVISELTIEEQGIKVLDLSDQSAGIYMINIVTENGTVTKRITIF